MMEAWVLCLLLADLVIGRDIPFVRNNTYEVKKIETCPDVGYYFRREPSPNAIDPGPCHLCFCQDNGTAHCWPRDSRRCDVEQFHHHRIGRETRIRRSPIGLSDIFFRDATRDFFNKQLPEECKPFEGSFSDGCPPADWCIGCTICDCNANGRWDCHVLSFCEGKEKKKKVDPNSLKRQRGIKHERRRMPFSQTKNNLDVSTSPPNKTVNRKIQPKPKHNKSIPVKQKSTKRKPYPKKGPQKPNKQKQIKQKQKKQRPGPQKRIKQKPNQQKLSKKKSVERKPNLRKPVKSKVKPINKKSYALKKQITKNCSKTNVKNIDKIQSKPQLKKQPQISKQKQAKSNLSNDKIIKGNGPSRKFMNRKNKSSMEKHNELKLGKNVVRQMMTAVKKLISEEIDKINTTLVLKDQMIRNVRNTSQDQIAGKQSKKRKNRKPHHSVEDYEHGRHKRTIFNYTQKRVENDIKDRSLNYAVPQSGNDKEISLTTNVPERIPTSELSENISQSFPTTVPRNMINNYFKYSMQNNNPNKTPTLETTDSVIGFAKDRNLSLFINLMVPAEPIQNISSNILNTHKPTTANPDFNDLKFKKWFVTKIKKKPKYKPVKIIILPKSKEQKEFVKAHALDNTLQTKDFMNKLGMSNYTEKKENYNCCNVTRKQLLTTTNRTNVTTGFYNTVLNIVRELKKNTTVNVKNRPKLHLMRYVREFFHKLFSRKKSRSYKVYSLGPREDHSLQVLCDNLGPCKIKQKNKYILKYKLKLLNNETTTILNSIRIIKGLLHLLNFTSSNLTNVNNSHSFQEDIQKLSVILRYSYNIGDFNPPLTETQLLQIYYIKTNTQTFIESIKRFVDILHEIIPLIGIDIENDKNTHISPKSQKSLIPFEKIKRIFAKYNILQNLFVRKMYDLIHYGHNKTIEAGVSPERVTCSNKLRTDENIDQYSRNIIENLRKLKQLAQTLNSTRKKRSSGDETVEYLLTMMDHLLRQKNPSNVLPAKDGIDFLIEAIKNAPDIKPFQMKLKKHNSVAKVIQSSMDTSGTHEISLGSIKVSKEEIPAFRKLSKEKFRKKLPSIENTDLVSKKVKYRIFTEKPTKLTYNDYVTTQNINMNINRNVIERKTGIDKLDSYINDIKNRTYEIYAGEVEDETAGDGVDNDDVLNKNYDRRSTSTETHASSTSTPVKNILQDDIFHEYNPTKKQSVSKEYTQNYLEANNTLNDKFQETNVNIQSNETESDGQDSIYNDKNFFTSKLDWIERNFDREIREFSNLNVSDSTLPSVETRTPISLKKQHIDTVEINENISGPSKEKHLKSKEKATKEPKEDKVLSKKELVFLNSLDYGSEKSETAESEESSKEEAFPTYFG